MCLSGTFGHAVRKEIARQLPKLPTGEIAGQSWQANGKLAVAADREEAIRISYAYSPEHLELHVREPNYYSERLRNDGSLFIGEETTVAYGKKSIGTNHILPTSRSPRYTGGNWVGKFLKTVTEPVHDPGEEPPGRRRHRLAMLRRAHGRPCNHGPRARVMLRRETARP